MGFLHIILRGLSIVGEDVAVAKALGSIRPVVTVTGKALPRCAMVESCNNSHEKYERPNKEPVLGYRLGKPKGNLNTNSRAGGESANEIWVCFTLITCLSFPMD